jgi:hypothetical protein
MISRTQGGQIIERNEKRTLNRRGVAEEHAEITELLSNNTNVLKGGTTIYDAMYKFRTIKEAEVGEIRNDMLRGMYLENLRERYPAAAAGGAMGRTESPPPPIEGSGAEGDESSGSDESHDYRRELSDVGQRAIAAATTTRTAEEPSAPPPVGGGGAAGQAVAAQAKSQRSQEVILRDLGDSLRSFKQEHPAWVASPRADGRPGKLNQAPQDMGGVVPLDLGVREIGALQVPGPRGSLSEYMSDNPGPEPDDAPSGPFLSTLGERGGLNRPGISVEPKEPPSRSTSGGVAPVKKANEPKISLEDIQNAVLRKAASREEVFREVAQAAESRKAVGREAGGTDKYWGLEGNRNRLWYPPRVDRLNLGEAPPRMVDSTTKGGPPRVMSDYMSDNPDPEPGDASSGPVLSTLKERGGSESDLGGEYRLIYEIMTKEQELIRAIEDDSQKKIKMGIYPEGYESRKKALDELRKYRSMIGDDFEVSAGGSEITGIDPVWLKSTIDSANAALGGVKKTQPSPQISKEETIRIRLSKLTENELRIQAIELGAHMGTRLDADPVRRVAMGNLTAADIDISSKNLPEDEGERRTHLIDLIVELAMGPKGGYVSALQERPRAPPRVSGAREPPQVGPPSLATLSPAQISGEKTVIYRHRIHGSKFNGFDYIVALDGTYIDEKTGKKKGIIRKLLEEEGLLSLAHNSVNVTPPGFDGGTRALVDLDTLFKRPVAGNKSNYRFNLALPPRELKVTTEDTRWIVEAPSIEERMAKSAAAFGSRKVDTGYQGQATTSTAYLGGATPTSPQPLISLDAKAYSIISLAQGSKRYMDNILFYLNQPDDFNKRAIEIDYNAIKSSVNDGEKPHPTDVTVNLPGNISVVIRKSKIGKKIVELKHKLSKLNQAIKTSQTLVITVYGTDEVRRRRNHLEATIRAFQAVR